ncbi:LptF/LptG family permease [Bacteriovorax sp. Seq25_V]|uniref:LptF/LptG family permease n=1 Tax=Bacteriovorax sp. Seq25_V TaxID=1201288 RepID=UPI000A00DEDE|nr:LptF/LptG family permease [Bacteriovorax sp. Seq25_V]
MFKLYQRYLAASFIPPFGMSLFFFVCFLLTTQLFRLMRVVTKKGVGLDVMFELFGQIALAYLPMVVPLALLFAMIYTLNKLSEDSEIVAIRAMGISKEKLFMPFIVLAVLCSVSIFSVNRNIIPHSNKLFQNTVLKLTSSGFLADIKKEKFYTEIPGVILFAEDVYDDGKKMERVFIKIKSNSDKEKIIFAKRGALIKTEDLDNPSLDIRLDLFEGNITSLDKDGDKVEKILFQKYEFPIVSDTTSGTLNKDTMKTNTELIARIKNYKGQLPNLEGDPNKYREIRYLLRNSQLEYWSRYNIPLQCIAFVLIGFVFGVKKGRGKSGNTTLFAFVAVLIYYLCFFGGISLVKKSNLEPYVAIFFPTIMTLIFGSYFYKKLDWAS